MLSATAAPCIRCLGERSRILRHSHTHLAQGIGMPVVHHVKAAIHVHPDRVLTCVHRGWL